MILSDNVIQIGRLLKPYGIRGAVMLLFDKPEYGDIDTEYYFLEIDGIFVPFFVEEMTFSSDVSARVKFEDVNDEAQAAKLSKWSVFLHREAINNLELQNPANWDSFTGYAIAQPDGKTLGIVRSVDSATINVLFVVDSDNGEILIPATEDFIVSIDEDAKIIQMNLPEGLIENL
ncbi:MAG: ribosome maturation factor RimM [Dysgonamonadaceae bacterium]|jgi:16S rRNA processing protein RimM|nr:ribosome maturation factor RimM [Dysgonamonadaceae bacterium]